MKEKNTAPVDIGDKLRFTPAAWLEKTSEAARLYHDRISRDVLGVVEYINAAHRFCRVRYEAAGTVQHECFKF